jgi:hypothetical protein
MMSRKYTITLVFEKENYTNILRYPIEGQSKMDNQEKLATLGTQDEDNQIKNTTQYVLDTTMRKQTQIT